MRPAFLAIALFWVIGFALIAVSHHQPRYTQPAAEYTNNSQPDECYTEANGNSRCTVHLKHQALPHRPVDSLTNWGQGRAPTPGQCPQGTVEIEVDGVFLECLRGTN